MVFEQLALADDRQNRIDDRVVAIDDLARGHLLRLLLLLSCARCRSHEFELLLGCRHLRFIGTLIACETTCCLLREYLTVAVRLGLVDLG